MTTNFRDTLYAIGFLVLAIFFISSAFLFWWPLFVYACRYWTS